MRRCPPAIAAFACAVALAACGDDADPGVDEPAPPGETVQLAGLEYAVPIARQLNPRIPPDQELVAGRRPDGDRLFLGVFLRACNAGDDPETARPRITLTTSPFDRSYPPVSLDAGNPFAWHGGPVPPDGCQPPEGSVDSEFAEGSLVLFEVPREAFTDRPLVLRLSRGGETRELELDL